MDKLQALCKNRGFIFAGSEIYGGLANTWDYGPLGVEFKNNVKKAWWRKFVQEYSQYSSSPRTGVTPAASRCPDMCRYTGSWSRQTARSHPGTPTAARESMYSVNALKFKFIASP